MHNGVHADLTIGGVHQLVLWFNVNVKVSLLSGPVQACGGSCSSHRDGRAYHRDRGRSDAQNTCDPPHSSEKSCGVLQMNELDSMLL